MLTTFPNFFRPVSAICWGAACWSGQMVADAIPSADMSWFQLLVKDVGLPIAFLILMIYGVVTLFKELKESQRARIADRDIFQTLLLEITHRTQDRQERQIVATDNLSGEFTHLANKIENCQHQRPQ